MSTAPHKAGRDKIVSYQRTVQGALGRTEEARSSLVAELFTREGAEVEVIMPNGDLISARVTNWTLTDRRHRVHMKVGVAYGTDPEEVLDILLKVAQAHPDVLHTPSPCALFRGFGDSSLDFELRVWTQNTLRGWQAALQSDLSVAINKTLAERGIEIPFPQRDLHVRGVVPELQEVLREKARQQSGSRAPSDRKAPASASGTPAKDCQETSKSKDEQ